MFSLDKKNVQILQLGILQMHFKRKKWLKKKQKKNNNLGKSVPLISKAFLADMAYVEFCYDNLLILIFYSLLMNLETQKYGSAIKQFQVNLKIWKRNWNVIVLPASVLHREDRVKVAARVDLRNTILYFDEENAVIGTTAC